MGYAYTTEGKLGRERAAGIKGPEHEPTGINSVQPLGKGQVDPSVRLGELKGEINGNVPMERQMAKPQAYVAKKGSP